MNGIAYIKTSLIDFPGRLASVLFLPGCDLRCPYCHNAALVRVPADTSAGAAATGDEAGLAPLEEIPQLPRQAEDIDLGRRRIGRRASHP